MCISVPGLSATIWIALSEAAFDRIKVAFATFFTDSSSSSKAAVL
jgi:hypothetical protein